MRPKKYEDSFITSIKLACKGLKGFAKRQYIAKMAIAYFDGSPRKMETHIGVKRKMVDLAIKELESGIRCLENFSLRGRKKEQTNPCLVTDISDVVEEHIQTDPTFKTTRCYLKITTQFVKERLNDQKGYKTSFCCHKTLNNILNRLGYGLKKVLKCKPLKKIPQTDAIFDNVSVRHSEAKQDKGILRISIDTKAIVKIGELSRDGYNRLQTPLQTCDHDQHWDSILIPFGIHEINHDHVSLYFGNSSSTAHFIVDALEQWYEDRKEHIKDYHTIMIDADNGKPNASNSGFFMERMVTFSQKINKKIQLVYYPPYHSKYNPIERFWAILEKYWSGCILDSVENTFKIVQNVKYKGNQVSSKLLDKIYQKTKVYNKKDWVKVNPFIERKNEIEKWDVLISPFN